MAGLDGIVQDMRFAARALRRSPGFTCVAIATLAVGIGVNAAVFTVTNAVLFRGFPHVDPDNRILYIGTNRGLSYPDFQDWKAQAKSFDGMAAVVNGGLRLILNDTGGVADGTQLSANSFQVLGQKPILGRDFAPFDAVPGAPSVTILNYSFWERRYGKDPSTHWQNNPAQWQSHNGDRRHASGLLLPSSQGGSLGAPGADSRSSKARDACSLVRLRPHERGRHHAQRASRNGHYRTPPGKLLPVDQSRSPSPGFEFSRVLLVPTLPRSMARCGGRWVSCF